MNMTSRYLSVADVADHLGIAPKTVYQQWRAWGLIPIRIGGGTAGPLRFRVADIDRIAHEWTVSVSVGSP